MRGSGSGRRHRSWSSARAERIKAVLPRLVRPRLSPTGWERDVCRASEEPSCLPGMLRRAAAFSGAARCARMRMSLAGGLVRPKPILAADLRPARFGPPPAWWPQLGPVRAAPTLEPPPPPPWWLADEHLGVPATPPPLPEGIDFDANLDVAIDLVMPGSMRAPEEIRTPMPDGVPPAPIEMMPKRTWQPNRLKRKRTHGFLSRIRTTSGRKLLKRRRLKGRWRTSVT